MFSVAMTVQCSHDICVQCSVFGVAMTSVFSVQCSHDICDPSVTVCDDVCVQCSYDVCGPSVTVCVSEF